MVRHRDVVLAHMKELGLRLNAKESVLSPLQRSRTSERRPITHCQAVSETAWSDGICIQWDTFWPAVHETPTVVAQDQGVFPEGQPTSHDQGHAVMLLCLRHVKKALVLVSGPGVGNSLSLHMLTTDASLTSWVRS